MPVAKPSPPPPLARVFGASVLGVSRFGRMRCWLFWLYHACRPHVGACHTFSGHTRAHQIVQGVRHGLCGKAMYRAIVSCCCAGVVVQPAVVAAVAVAAAVAAAVCGCVRVLRPRRAHRALMRPVLHWLLDFTGHDELLVLMGMLLSVVIGGMGFEAMGLSAEIGALAMGVMLSGHPRANELSHSLWPLKEIFLVGFFLQIGMSGLPDRDALIFALAVAVILPLKGVLFYALLVAFKLRARSAFLSSLSLTAYSEFGLIVSAAVLPEFLVPLALAVSLSFVISSPLNRMAHPLYDRVATGLSRFQRKTIHPDEQAKDLGDGEVLLLYELVDRRERHLRQLVGLKLAQRLKHRPSYRRLVVSEGLNQRRGKRG